MNRAQHRGIVAVAFALLIALLSWMPCASAQWAKTTQTKRVTLNASPPSQNTQTDPVTIRFEYTVSEPLEGPGKAEVTLHNVDSGQEFKKSIEIALIPGKTKEEVVWKPRKSIDDAVEDLLDEKAGSAGGGDEILPAGMYVTKVVLFDAKGSELVSWALDPELVKTLMMVGGATRIVDVDVVMAGLRQYPVWRKELQELEEKAKAAGADTTRQHVLSVVIKEAEFWSREQLGMKMWDILDTNYSYLKQTVAETKIELEKLAADPASMPRTVELPRPKERFKIRDGYFYAGDTPVFLSGPCVFNFTLRYLPVARDLGFNVIQVSTGPNSVFPDSEEPTGTPRVSDYGPTTTTGQIKDVLDECAKLGIKVDLGLTAHFMPKWVFEKWPDAANNSTNYMLPYDIEHPEVLKLIERFFDIVMPQIAGHPALNSIWVANEPGYMNPNERNLAIFRPWLQEKYKTIEALNAAWGTQLTSFDEILYAPSMNMQGAYADWWWYTSERLSRHFNWMMDLVHKYDPDLPTSVKLFNATFNPEFKPPSRANEEPVFDMSAYTGYDGGSFPFSKPYKDFIRSLDPSKPMANLEYKFGWQRAKLDFWQEAMQGASDINWWCWHPKASFSPVPSFSRAVHYAALDMLEIQRLMPEIMAFNKQPRAPMVFLYPNAVHPRLHEYFAINEHANRALTLMGYTVDYASEKRVAEGRLDKYRVLVMPAADFIRDETFAEVTAFIEKGGTAIVIGALPSHDEMSRPRTSSFFTPKGKVESIAVGDLKATKYAAGKGVIYHLAEVPRKDDKSGHLSPEAPKLIQAYLEAVLREALPPQPVVIRNSEGQPFIENRTVAYTNAAGVKTFLSYVGNDWLDGAQTIEPKFNFKVKTCRDLISGKTLDPSKIVIPPVDVMMLEFTVDE